MRRSHDDAHAAFAEHLVDAVLPGKHGSHVNPFGLARGCLAHAGILAGLSLRKTVGK
jgi:hypothetical protein